MVYSWQMGVSLKIWLTPALSSWMRAWLDVRDSRSLTHINPRLPAFSYLTWCVSSCLFTSLLDFLVLDMHSVVLNYWCIACFWLLVIQWISGMCWDTVDILPCSLSTLPRNHFFICFELSNLRSSLTCSGVKIYYLVMAPSPRVVHSLATSLNIFKTLFPSSHFDILRGWECLCFPII